MKQFVNSLIPRFCITLIRSVLFTSEVKQIFNICSSSETQFLIVYFRFIKFKSNGKFIIAHPNTIIKHANNIITNGIIKVGVDYVGFTHNKDTTYLNINGKLEFEGYNSIGRGCRFDIGKNAYVRIGEGSYINSFTKLIIMHKLEIGKSCAVSWDCEFLDEDFHEIKYDGKKINSINSIFVGDKVWIGSKVTILKGTYIPNGCVVASNSVVRNIFTDENVLIAGNPAIVIKRNVKW